MALITLAQAKLQLYVDDEAHDTDILLKMDQATGIIVGRCNSTAHWRAVTPTWTDATVPPGVQTAIFLMLTHLYENRGNDMKTDELLWAAVDRFICLNKDQVLA